VVEQRTEFQGLIRLGLAERLREEANER